MLREVEHFQNQFIVQKQNIDAFLHDINADEHKLVEFAKDHPVALNHVHFEDHPKHVITWKVLQEPITK